MEKQKNNNEDASKAQPRKFLVIVHSVDSNGHFKELERCELMAVDEMGQPVPFEQVAKKDGFFAKLLSKLK